MTELTQEQRATLARAIAREGKTTPKPWVRMHNGQIMSGDTVSPEMGWYDAEKRGVYVVIENDHYINIDKSDAELITDAPNVDDLCRAQADIIAQQAARIAELEASADTAFSLFYSMCLGKPSGLPPKLNEALNNLGKLTSHMRDTE